MQEITAQPALGLPLILCADGAAVSAIAGWICIFPIKGFDGIRPAIRYSDPDAVGGDYPAAGPRSRYADPESFPACRLIRPQPVKFQIRLVHAVGIADVGTVILFHPEGETFVRSGIRFPDGPGSHFDILVPCTDKEYGHEQQGLEHFTTVLPCCPERKPTVRRRLVHPSS